MWWDRKIIAGQPFDEAIEQALQQADSVIFLISQPALESDEVYRELVRAIELEKAIVPLRLDQVPLYGWFKEKLGAIQHIEYDAQDSDEKWWGKLLAALRRSRRVSHRRKEPVNAEPEPSPSKALRKRGSHRSEP